MVSKSVIFQSKYRNCLSENRILQWRVQNVGCLVQVLSPLYCHKHASLNGVIIGLDNRLSPVGRQAIILTHDDFSLITPQGNNIEANRCSSAKLQLKLTPAICCNFSISQSVDLLTARSMPGQWNKSHFCNIFFQLQWRNMRVMTPQSTSSSIVCSTAKQLMCSLLWEFRSDRWHDGIIHWLSYRDTKKTGPLYSQSCVSLGQSSEIKLCLCVMSTFVHIILISLEFHKDTLGIPKTFRANH